MQPSPEKTHNIHPTILGFEQFLAVFSTVSFLGFSMKGRKRQHKEGPNSTIAINHHKSSLEYGVFISLLFPVLHKGFHPSSTAIPCQSFLSQWNSHNRNLAWMSLSANHGWINSLLGYEELWQSSRSISLSAVQNSGMLAHWWHEKNIENTKNIYR